MPVGDGGNNGRILSSILNTDEGTRRLIEKILMIDPSKRFTAEQALNDEYFHMPIKAEVNTSSASEPEHSLVFRSPPSKVPIKTHLQPTSSSNPVDVTPDPSHQQRQQERRHPYTLDQRSNFGTTAGYGISPPTKRLCELDDPSRTFFEAAFLHD
jgi:serine/threonine protein kinase